MQEPESPTGAPRSPIRPKKRRQKRTVYSMEQRLQLEGFFKVKQYGTYEERETLANKLNLQEQQVQVWLKNRRAKHRRLQRLLRQQGPGDPAAPQEPWAPAAPQEPAVCAPQPVPAPLPAPEPAPAPAGPAFQGNPELPSTPVFPEEPVFPSCSLHYRGPGFGSPPPPSPLQVFPEAEPSVFSYSQASWGPAQSYPGLVPAAPAPAPAPAPAQTGVSPQGAYAFSFSPDPVVTPGVTDLRSASGPLEGSFSSCQSWPEEEEDPYKLLDL
ncbi:hypothetical protein QTO34_010191 [Cnephaeus nilssonii]|uniref:Homeobox domain-containing protein n=1 Tax=Cnephaeus nilssonii TaxID=3371016 RepID=A0AA40HF21_CNENI|nr:hypothetical protein QTO34_010191 [Eptesicus nilssonii]